MRKLFALRRESFALFSLWREQTLLLRTSEERKKLRRKTATKDGADELQPTLGGLRCKNLPGGPMTDSGGRPRKYGRETRMWATRIPVDRKKWLMSVRDALEAESPRGWTLPEAHVAVLDDARNGGDPVLRAIQAEGQKQILLAAIRSRDREIEKERRARKAAEQAATKALYRVRTIMRLLARHVPGHALVDMDVHVQADGAVGQAIQAVKMEAMP